MHPKDRKYAAKLKQLLRTYDSTVCASPGIADDVACDTLIEQVLESIRRIEFIKAIQEKPISPTRADPNSENFDPIRASLFHYQQGNIDEACWLAFLAVHFGRHLTDKWRLARDIYGALGSGQNWTWQRIIASPQDFGKWLSDSYSALKEDGVPRRFGNHRRYSTLKVSGKSGSTASALETYIDWVGRNRGHAAFIEDAISHVGDDPYALFDYLYQDMDKVSSFARLGKFDFLTMIGKLGYAPIEPGIPYLVGASGPLRGAELLFKGGTASELDSKVKELGNYLDLGMQVMEDSLCNWQKSPTKFIAFRG